MHHLIYRSVTPEDAAALIAYSNAVGGESDNLTFGLNAFHTTLETETAYLSGLCTTPACRGLVCECDREIIAFATLTVSSRPRIAHRGNIGISVRKAFWGQGIARSMLTELIAFARHAPLDFLELQVRADHAAAIHLYATLGFVPIACWPGFFKIDQHFYDALLMQLKL